MTRPHGDFANSYPTPSVPHKRAAPSGLSSWSGVTVLAILLLTAACQSQSGLVGPEELPEAAELSTSAAQLTPSFRPSALRPGGERGKKLGWEKIDVGSSGGSVPSASFDYDCAGLTCTFTNTSSDPDGDIEGWIWDLGDGSTTAEGSPTHLYTSDGTYKVVLSVYDALGNVDKESKAVTVAEDEGSGSGQGTPTASNSPPTAAFIHACSGRQCDFADESQDSDGSIATHHWEFGDGNTSSAANPSHTYDSDGDFMVTLTVQDDASAEDQTAAQVSVAEPSSEPQPAPNEPPVAAAEVSCVDLDCSFDGSGSSDPDGEIGSYTWDFGDGSTAQGSTAQHSYAAGGTYVVKLTVTDDGGSKGATKQELTVSEPEPTPEPAPNEPPVASAKASCNNLDCSFDAAGSYDPDGEIVSYSWDFGDNSSAQGSTAQHSYAQAGTYRVTLTVTDDKDAKSSTERDVPASEPVSNGPSASRGSYGPLFGVWGARHDRTHYSGRGSDMEEAVRRHGFNAFQYGNTNPAGVLKQLDAMAAIGAHGSFRIVERVGNYGQSGKFDLAAWKADMDAFWAEAASRGVKNALLAHVSSGTWWGVMIGDDIGSYGTPPPDAATWDEMCKHLRSYAPGITCWVRTQLGNLPKGTYTELDLVMPQYRGKNHGPVSDFADTQIALLRDRGIPNIMFSVNVEKGDCSSGVVATSKENDDCMVSPAEIEAYHAEFASRPETSGLWFWEYDSANTSIRDCPDDSFASYFDEDRCVPGVAQAVASVRGMLGL